MTVLVGSLLPQPTPKSPDADLLALWRRHVPASRPDENQTAALASAMPSPTTAQVIADARDGSGDHEDWTEMAARLRALLSSNAEALWLSWGRRTGAVVEHARIPDARIPDAWAPTGRSITPEAAAAMIASGQAAHYGPLQESSPLMAASNNRADRYFEADVFHRHAGRPTVMAGIPDPDEPFDGPSVEAEMARLAAAGHGRAFVKHRGVKRGVWTVPTSTDERANRQALLDVMDWDLIRFEGTPRLFLVQPHVEMRYEYRAFVVDGRPVTGAACIEHHTPTDNTGEAFDDAVIAHRGVDGPESVERRPDLRDEAVAFATTVAADVATAGDPFGRAHVLDVALGADGWLAVEFNGLDNAGLYASDPVRVTRALTGAPAAAAWRTA